MDQLRELDNRGHVDIFDLKQKGLSTSKISDMLNIPSEKIEYIFRNVDHLKKRSGVF